MSVEIQHSSLTWQLQNAQEESSMKYIKCF